jgi:hypothetical protein
MKRNDLIAELMKLPEDAEIVTFAGDDVLADYHYNTEVSIEEEVAGQGKKGTLWATYGNYHMKSDKPVTVYVIR